MTLLSDGAVVQQKNLSEPYEVFIATRGALENETVSCAFWDAARGEWVADGVVLARDENGTLCAFAHLTSFGGFVGPMNELGSMDDLFSLDMWATGSNI